MSEKYLTVFVPAFKASGGDLLAVRLMAADFEALADPQRRSRRIKRDVRDVRET